MFFSDDLITNRHPHASPFTDLFDSEEGVKNAPLPIGLSQLVIRSCLNGSAQLPLIEGISAIVLYP